MLKNVFLTLMLFLSFGHEVWSSEVRYHERSASLINWQKIKPINWLDIDEWKATQILKDQNPEWESMLRDRNLDERTGQILDCVGSCVVHRGEGFFKGSYRSPIYEGDEIHTAGESYAWIFLVDGTLVRLSPESSLTVKEINIAPDINFIHARLNSGHITWISRSVSKVKEMNIRDTDALFFPLAMYEANNFAYEEDKEDEEDLYYLVADKPIWQQHYQRLNKMIEQNNEGFGDIKKTKNFFVLPNGNITGEAISGEFIVLVGGKSYVKLNSPKTLRLESEEGVNADIEYFYRGYENTQNQRMSLDTWYEIDAEGRTISYYEEPSWFRMGSFVTSRISSFYLARELMLQQTKDFVFNRDVSPLTLAKDYGYRLWNVSKRHETKNEIELRVDFLKEYTRRTETTNLFVAAKFKRQMEEKGESVSFPEYSEKFFQKALESYYHKGKSNQEYGTDRQNLNSTNKKIWKKMNAKRR